MITIEANYSKKIGLAGYSSHQYSVTLKSELSDVSRVQEESARLYGVLQQSVDDNIRQVGFLPAEPKSNGNGNGHSNGNGYENRNSYARTNGHSRNGRPGGADDWNCSPKQKDLILKITDENRLDKNEVERLAQNLFGKGVKQLNKMDASGLIEELLEKHPAKKAGRLK